MSATLGLAAGLGPRSTFAQAPGVPIAPSAFIRPGLAGALNVGRGNEEYAALAAVAFGGGEGRWQIMGGVGGLTTAEGFRSPALTYGGRFGYRVFGRERLGVVAFAGLGGARLRTEERGDASDGTLTSRQLPLGVAAGYRGRWGEATSGRAWGVTLAPAWVQQSLRVSDEVSIDGSGVRATAMAEVALSRRIGLSLAYEDGQRAKSGEPGPRGGVWGVAVALAR